MLQIFYYTHLSHFMLDYAIRYRATDISNALQQIQQTGYGLTQGIHSRIKSNIAQMWPHLAIGNLYINRNMTGAVVGVQPFGGQGLSGTGPKARWPSLPATPCCRAHHHHQYHG